MVGDHSVRTVENSEEFGVKYGCHICVQPLYKHIIQETHFRVNHVE